MSSIYIYSTNNLMEGNSNKDGAIKTDLYIPMQSLDTHVSTIDTTEQPLKNTQSQDLDGIETVSDIGSLSMGRKDARDYLNALQNEQTEHAEAEKMLAPNLAKGVCTDEWHCIRQSPALYVKEFHGTGTLSRMPPIPGKIIQELIASTLISFLINGIGFSGLFFGWYGYDIICVTGFFVLLAWFVLVCIVHDSKYPYVSRLTLRLALSWLTVFYGYMIMSFAAYLYLKKEIRDGSA